MIDYTWICVGKLCPPCATALLFSEPIASNLFKFWGFVCPMENTPATGMAIKRKAPAKNGTSSQSLAEALDDCSVEVLEAVLLMLRSRSPTGTSASSQSENDCSSRKQSAG